MLENEVENKIDSVNNSIGKEKVFGYQTHIPYIVSSEDSTPTTTAL